MNKESANSLIGVWDHLKFPSQVRRDLVSVLLCREEDPIQSKIISLHFEIVFPN